MANEITADLTSQLHLKDDAVPSVFPYAPPTRKIRQTSVGRANARAERRWGVKC